jgi:hypothetical protein
VSASVIIYERGNKYVEHRKPEEKKDGKTEPAFTAYGLVGKLTVGGQTFDTLERMEGFVNLSPGVYPMSSMYDSGGDLGTVVNPWLGKHDKDPDKVNLLIHHATCAYNLKGCIAPGKLSASGAELTGSTKAMSTIWEQCGGSTDRKKGIIITLRVVGVMPARQTCARFAG